MYVLIQRIIIKIKSVVSILNETSAILVRHGLSEHCVLLFSDTRADDSYELPHCRAREAFKYQY